MLGSYYPFEFLKIISFFLNNHGRTLLFLLSVSTSSIYHNDNVGGPKHGKDFYFNDNLIPVSVDFKSSEIQNTRKAKLKVLYNPLHKNFQAPFKQKLLKEF